MFCRESAFKYTISLIILIFLLSACNVTEIKPTAIATQTIEVDATTATAKPSPTSTSTAVEEGTPEITKQEDEHNLEKTENLVNPLPPEPIEGTFQTSDGITLSGTFYPARAINAPLVVLFHWARGDQSEWTAIAPWLQNRGWQPAVDAGGKPWLDTSWFPTLPEGSSFNVFTFTFRNCEGGCQRFDREGWLLDIDAALAYVNTLENVDLSRVATMGASIGGDGAAYGCHTYNLNYGGCQGALSLSPGGYLTFTYAQEVANLASESPPTPAWCLYSIGDSDAARACESATGTNYQVFSYEDSAHGFALLEPGRRPNPLEIMLQFLDTIELVPSGSTLDLEQPMTYEVINEYPHDPEAYTHGLIYHEDYLYESTGLYGESSLRKVELETGQVVQQFELDSEYFAEGLTLWEDQFVQLTWLEHIGFVYNQDDFSLLRSFTYATEGWGLTHDGKNLIMSDGSSSLYFLDPDTFQVMRSINVTYQGEPVRHLNELEFIKGEVYANVYQTDDLVRINPATGEVLGWIDLSGLLPEQERTSQTDVLNGIAYDQDQDRIFVTGKLWPKLYEIRLIPAS